ncbi:MAG TPA: class I SAM-dependent methyltransferase [Thermomicrobiales bacterium]|nr:class I SAM-dependent methyltransferase [Thermomicrobiales bacterium]
MTDAVDLPWQESDSALFVEMGRVMIPQRDEIERVMLGLVPAGPDEAFTFVDVAAGAGWLTRAILERFPNSSAVVLDASETMLAEAAHQLADHEGWVTFQHFQLEEPDWEQRIRGDIRCVVSSLAIHHLDGPGKRALFRRLHERLEPGGGLLIADIVQPASEWARRLAAADWDEEVRRQSLELTRSLETYAFFDNERWNILEHPDPMDMPSPIAEQLDWLAQAGFTGVDVFWALAGHAVYGGYKP